MAIYAAQCEQRGWNLVAFVAETTGSFGQAAQRTVKKLARMTAMKNGDTTTLCQKRVASVISLAVARAVARQLLRALVVNLV